MASFRCETEVGRNRRIADFQASLPAGLCVHSKARRVAFRVTATTDFLAPDMLNKRGRAVPAQVDALRRTRTTARGGTAILRRTRALTSAVAAKAGTSLDRAEV